MTSQVVSTQHGNVELTDPTPELIQFIASRLPMGLEETSVKGERVFGIIFQRGDQEVLGVKFQQVEYTEEESQAWLQINSARLALSIPGHLKLGYGGLLIVGVYMRSKGNEQYEPGIAAFPVLDINGKECVRPPELARVDKQLGTGSSNLVMGMLQAISKVPDDVLPPFQPIDIDVLPKSLMGNLRLDFLICQQHILCLRRLISADDPLWGYAIKAGLNHLLHMPCNTRCAGPADTV